MLLEFPRMFQRLGHYVGGKGETVRRCDKEGTIWRGKGRENKVVEDRTMVGQAVVLGRCIVGVLAFNLTAQFH